MPEKFEAQGAEPELKEVKKKLAETMSALKEAGIKLSDITYRDLENGLITGAVEFLFLAKLVSAAKDFSTLKKEYVGKNIGAKGLESTPYLSSEDVVNIQSASSIDNFEELALHTKLLPEYRHKAWLIASHFLRGAYAENNKYEIKTVPGVSELVPLTATEMKAVHKMSVKKANAWLHRNDRRIVKLYDAAVDGLVSDKKTFDRLRSMDPFKATTEIWELREADKRKKRDAQKEKDDKELEELEKELD